MERDHGWWIHRQDQYSGTGVPEVFVSPYTRTSTLWVQGKSPFKPDIVMEAGNRVVSPARTDAYDADSLALLSTGPNTDMDPLVSFRATSAATAQAARLAARLMARFLTTGPRRFGR